MSELKNIRPTDGGYRWEGVEVMPYKEDGAAPFKAISRQLLFHRPELNCELRYFEMAAGGHSTLERHEHVHGVMIFRGRGLVLIGNETQEVGAGDLITIPPMTWHQFKASNGEEFGFLCMVNTARDKPLLPSQSDLDEMARDPKVAAFLSAS